MNEQRLPMSKALRARIKRGVGFASEDVYRSAPGWMRGDAGRLVAEVRVECARCGHVLAVVFTRQADGHRDGVLRSRGPLPVEPGGDKATLPCQRCGARPQVRLDRLAAAVDGIARPGERTTSSLRVA